MLFQQVLITLFVGVIQYFRNKADINCVTKRRNNVEIGLIRPGQGEKVP